MLKKYIFLLIAQLFLSTAFTQVHYGIKVGTGISNIIKYNRSLKFSGSEHYTPLLSYKTGIVFTTPVSEKSIFNAEMLLVNSRSTQHAGSSTQYKTSYYHLSFPIFFSFQLNEKTDFSIGLSNIFLIYSNSVITNKYNLGFISSISLYKSKKFNILLDFNFDIMPFAQTSNYPGLILEEEYDTLYYLYSTMLNVVYTLK